MELTTFQNEIQLEGPKIILQKAWPSSSYWSIG